MNETRRSTEHQHQGHQGSHGSGINVMSLLMAAATAVFVALFLVPSLGLLLGIGAAILAGGAMLAMHGGASGGHGGHGGNGSSHRHGC